MNIEVYDTYATSPDGLSIHFDVLLPKGSTASQAESIALHWLKEIEKEIHGIQLESTRYCHSELASTEAYSSISTKGYAILQLEGCPQPKRIHP